jgi:hypothetical protein
MFQERANSLGGVAEREQFSSVNLLGFPQTLRKIAPANESLCYCEDAGREGQPLAAYVPSGGLELFFRNG